MVIVPPMPMPLPVTVDLTVTSANAGATACNECDECDENRDASFGHLHQGSFYFYCCCDAVVRGLAFFAHSFAQFNISAMVCSTDSRAV